MRKIYSIVLTACTLLFGTSLFAETRNVSVSEWADLKSNIESAQAGDVLNITVAQTINADGAAPIRIYASKDAATGITVNLNMNGKSIVASNMKRVFELYRGTLNVTGDGEIRANEYGKNSVIAFFVAGYSSQATSDWSHLIIGKNIKVEAPGSNICGYAISVNEVQAYSQSKTVTDNNYPIADDVDVSAHFNDLGITFTRKKDFNFLDYTTEWYTTSNGTTLGGKKATAYGVVVDIYGTVHASKYAVKVNGNINSKPEAEYMTNLPTINVYPGAQMLADNAKKSVAVYASGYANYNIEGTVKGATGVYIKSGNVTLENATIASTYSGDYEEITTGKKSGVQAGGSGVVIESNPSYCGGQDVKITGDTKIEATSGYAVEENITTPDNSTKVNALTIEGGTLIAGGKGTVIVTQQTLDAEETVVSVVGGNFDGDGKFQVKDTETGETTSAEVKDFLPNDNYFTTTVIDANNKEVTVVTNGTGFGSINKEDGNSVVATTSGAIVWKNSTTKTETINLDVLTAAEKQDNNTRTLSYLEINNDDYEQTLIIDGVTLRVGRIVMGKNAHIIVKAGARLIVDGEQGIVAPVVSNLVLETSETTPAQFLFNPGVNSNRHPNATVSLIANSYTSATEPKVDYLYQRFGVPTYNAVKNVTAKKDGADVQVFFRIYENNGWTSLGYLNVAGQSLRKDRLNTPFGYYTLQCNTPEVGTVVSFEGELMGNDNAALATGANTNGWSTFANSYSANLNMESMLSMFDGLPEGSNAAIYFQKNQAGTDNMFDWNIIDQTKLLVLSSSQIQALINLNPMQSFLIKDPASDITMSLNYKTMVWEPATGTASGAPRRAMSDLTKAAINLSYDNAAHDAVYMIQGDEFSAEIESGYDSEKYMSGKANIYVMNDKKYATCATNDLENTYIGFSCAEAGNYTISFENIAGEGLALVDMVANKVIDMTEGAEYEFYAQESNDYRFKVVGRNNVSTAVENVENAATKAAGVYTLTGMYLGNMSVWNTLPAGVYVVDGEKRVK